MLLGVKNSCRSLVLTCLVWQQCMAQVPRESASSGTEINIDTFIEELFALQDEDVNYDDLYESLFQLYTSPVDLNLATFEDLSSLYLFNPLQIESFLRYRSLNGPLLSLYELQAVPHLDLATIRRIRPFVTIGSSGQNRLKGLFRRVIEENNNYLIVRTERTLEQARGYTPPDTSANGGVSSRYAGDPFKHYARFRVSHPNDFSFGFTMEKDAGEAWQWNNQNRVYGADFYSFHGQIKNQGHLKSINVGDYQLQMGQGLVFGAGFAAGKGGETLLTVKRNSVGLIPYSSVLETGFFRGAATTYAIGKWEVTGLVSRMRQDGTVRTDTLSDLPEEYISSILGTGFHRTPTELAGRNQVVEHGTGGSVLYKGGTFQAGITALLTHFSTPIQKRPALYNQFEFAGKTNQVGSIHFSKIWQNTQFFGEVARSSSGGSGAIGGMMISLTNQLGVSMVTRNYDRDFHSFYARSFGEGSRNINERGIYWGLKWKATSRLQFTTYYDRFSFPWLRFNVDAPSQGHEYLAMATYSLSRLTRAYVQFRQQSKAINGSTISNNVQLPVQGKKENLVINVDHDTGHLLSFKSRVQLSRYGREGSSTAGFAVVQDVNLQFNRWRLSSRVAMFDTDDYDNRQYVYEKDVLYAFSIPAYFGRGLRSYLMAQYQVSKKLTVWGRWSKFSFRNAEKISSGQQEINGQMKNDFKLQLKISLF